MMSRVSTPPRERHLGPAPPAKTPAAAEPSYAVPSLAEAYHAADPAERDKWLQEAQRHQGELIAPPEAKACAPARLPPVNSEISRRLEPKDWPAAPVCPALEFSAETFPQLTATQRTCLSRIWHCPDVFLLQGLPATGTEATVAGLVWHACRAGERLLICSAGSLAADRLLAHLRHDPEVAAVRLGNPPPALAALAPEPRGRELAESRARRAEARQKAAEGRRSLLQRWLAEAATWRAELQRLRELHEAVLHLQEALAKVHPQLEADVAEGRVDERTPWVRQRSAEVERHQQAKAKLEEVLANRQADCARAATDLAKWQAELKKQTELQRMRSFPNPFSPLWWRAILQSRSAQRKEEFRARVQDAEIQHLAARADQQVAEEQLEIELRRHQAALEQIMRAERDRRHKELEQTLAATQQDRDALRNRWQAWLAAHAATAQAEGASEEVVLEGLNAAWQAELAKVEQSLETETPSQADLNWEGRADEVKLLLPSLTNLVVVNREDLPGLAGTADPWFQPGFDRVIILDAEQFTRGEMESLGSWAQRLVLVGSPPLAEERDSHFDTLWRQARPVGSPAAMRWLREGDLWHCLWIGLTPELENHLHREPLVDAEDIDLYLVEPPGQAPRLAALAFPAARFTLQEAKQFHARELMDWAVDPIDTEFRLRTEPRRLIVEYCQPAAGELLPIPYPDGVTEWAAPMEEAEPGFGQTVTWRTKQLDFSVQEGWTWEKVSEWLSRHASRYDATRSFSLAEAEPASSELIAAWNLLLENPPFAPAELKQTGLLRWQPAAEPTMAAKENPSLKRLDSRHGTPATARAWASFNVVEAKAVVEAAAQLVRQHEHALPPSLLLLAASEPQRQLLERQWQLQATASAPASAARCMTGSLQCPPAGSYDLVAVSLWPEREGQLPSPRGSLTSLAGLLRRCRGRLLLVGDLNVLLPAAWQHDSRRDGDAAAHLLPRLLALQAHLQAHQDSVPSKARA